MTAKVDVSGKNRQASPPTERVMRILELLASAPERSFTLSDISRGLGISHGTCHAIVSTLASRQWIVRDIRGAGYSWGPVLGALAQPANDRVFRAELQRLAEGIGAQVVLAVRRGPFVVVTDVVGASLTAPHIGSGFRMPLVAPFGREFVAWAPNSIKKEWLGALAAPSPRLRRRLNAVLDEVQQRGYVVERLSREYVRVYSALRALAADGEPDPITARVASAFADLTMVDYLAGELDDADSHEIAIVSAPIRDIDGGVTMSIGAAPFATLDATGVRRLGAAVRKAAVRIESRQIAGTDAD